MSSMSVKAEMRRAVLIEPLGRVKTRGIMY
jgi:hypothetical protein